nr:putative ribonuclease H-like domain-containing protein [Tanacetum cinerariifolium]
MGYIGGYVLGTQVKDMVGLYFGNFMCLNQYLCSINNEQFKASALYMTSNKSFLIEYQEIDGGFVAFRGSPKGGKITEKGKIRTGKLDFEDVYFVKELKFNLFSVSQMCDKKNSVLFTKTECLFLSPDFKLLDESQVLLKVPRQNNMYSFDLKNVVPSGDLTCLFAKDTIDESNFWHRRLGSGPKWLFDIDSLTKSMNYELVYARNQSNGDAGIQTDIHAGQAFSEKAAVHDYILLPFISSNPPLFSTIQSSDVNAGDQLGDVNVGDIQGDVNEISRNDDVCQGNEIRIDSSTNTVNAASTSINTSSNIIVVGSLNINTANSNHTNMPTLEATRIFDGAFNDRDLGAEAHTNNLESSTVVSHIPTTRVHKDHPKEQIIRDPNLHTQTRRMIKFSKEGAMVSFINRQKRTNHKDFQNCLFACFLSQMEPKKVIQALKDPSWIEAMQEELLQFKLQDNNKTISSICFIQRLHSLSDGCEECVFIWNNRGRGVCFQPPGFEDPDFPDKVYKVKKALYGLHQALRAWYETLSTYLLNNGFKRGQTDKTLFIKRNKGDILLVQMSSMGELTFFLVLQVKQKQDGIFISQDKYVAEILKKFGFFEVKTASTLMETSKTLLKDEDGQECKKQTVVVNSITEAEYVAASKIALDDETQGRTNDDEMFRVDDLVGEEVVVETTTSIKDSAAPTTDVTKDKIIMAQALAALKIVKPKVVVHEQEMSTIIPAAATKVTTVVPTLRAKDMEADDDDNPDDVAKNFKIEGNLFDFEIPLCKPFNEFNYLSKIDTDLFTFEVYETKTYKGHEYKLNKDMTGDHE